MVSWVRMLAIFTAVNAVIVLAGCATAYKVSQLLFCQNPVGPMTPTHATVGFLKENDLPFARQVYDYNETGRTRCGWKPPKG